MDAAHSRRTREVFDAVRDLPDGRRDAAIERLCAGDQTLARDVRELLDEPPPGFLSSPALPPPAGAAGAAPRESLPPGTVLAGKYEVGELIGRGSWGAVHRGRHRELGKTVAIKILDRDPSAPETLTDMVREAITGESPNFYLLRDHPSEDDEDRCRPKSARESSPWTTARP